MAAHDTLAFTDADPVTGLPTVDGFVYPDAGITTNETEPGYVRGSRMTFGGSGFPPVIFQGVKNGNSLHLAFMCRGDLSFDAEDVVVVALGPSQNPAQGSVRRIDIFPVFEAVGASGTNPATGGPDGSPDDVPAGVPLGSNYFIRTGRAPAKLHFYKGQTSGAPWSPYTPASHTPSTPPTGPYQASVRSWQPPVASAPNEYAWSVELKIPINKATGGADWIDLNDGFGLYFNVIRLGKVAASGTTPSQTWYSTQFRFPQQVSGNVLTGILDSTIAINPAWYGKGLIPALQSPPNSNVGEGVRIMGDIALWTPLIGRRAAGSSTTTLGHTISGTQNNELVALVENTSPTDVANGVTAEFRFANWGLGAANFHAWAKPPGLTPNPSNAKNLPVSTDPASKNVPLVSNWPATSVPSEYKDPYDHQCVWVQLNSTSSVNFTQSSARRNMDFINLSEEERLADISGVGYPTPAGGGTRHEFLLFTRARKIPLPPRSGDVLLESLRSAFAGSDMESVVPAPGAGAGPMTHVPPRADVYYVWITEGYRRTGETLQIGSKVAEILDGTPGAFGYVAQHTGVNDELEWEFAGPRLRLLGDGVYSIPVPHNGKVTINTKVRTVRDGMGGARAHDTGGDSGGGGGGGKPGESDGWISRKLGNLPFWVWLLLILILLILVMR
jgi:hypothetical protein